MEAVTLQPVGILHGNRKTPIDDQWDSEISTIELDAKRFTSDALMGLTDFTHLEVVFLMHLVPQEEIEVGARHPRGRKDWPRVGIFSQRGKGRPNRVGVSRCKLLRVEGLKVTVQGLDAIDGTPIIDIKPYMAEFGPRGDFKQPEWATEIMKDYY